MGVNLGHRSRDRPPRAQASGYNLRISTDSLKPACLCDHNDGFSDHALVIVEAAAPQTAVPYAKAHPEAAAHVQRRQERVHRIYR